MTKAKKTDQFVSIDPSNCEVTVGGRTIQLSQSEFLAVQTLIKNSSRIVKHHELSTRNFTTQDAISQAITRIRKRLGAHQECGRCDRYITTRHKTGYQFCSDALQPDKPEPDTRVTTSSGEAPEESGAVDHHPRRPHENASGEILVAAHRQADLPSRSSKLTKYTLTVGALLSCALLGAGMVSSHRESRRVRALEVRRLLDEAVDWLGGKPGSVHVTTPPGLSEQRVADIERARRNVARALILDPKSTRAHQLRGLHYLLTGNRHDARAEFEHALRLDPTNTDALCSLGDLLAEYGMYDLALQNFDRARDIDASCVLAYTGRASAILRRYLAQRESSIRTSMGLFYAGRGLDSVARIEFLNRSALFTPDGRFKTADHTPEQTRQLEEGVAAASRATQIDPNYVEAHRLLGNLFDILGKDDLAFDAYQRALRIAADDPYLRFDYGLALLGSGDDTGALMQLMAAVKLNRGYCKALAFLGAALFRHCLPERGMAALLESERCASSPQSALPFAQEIIRGNPELAERIRTSSSSLDNGYWDIAIGTDASQSTATRCH